MSDIALKEQVYLDYKDRVQGYIRGKVSNYEDVEDLLSGVFLKVYENFDRYDSAKASLSTWIYTITHNEVCNYYRANSKKGYVLDIDDVPKLSDKAEPFIDTMLKEEEIESLALALEQLPQRERDIIVLRFYNGYTPSEVGVAMNISYSNAKFLQHRAIGKLKKIMLED